MFFFRVVMTPSLKPTGPDVLQLLDSSSVSVCHCHGRAPNIITSRMTAADVIVPALREDVSRRVRPERAEDPGVRRAWAKQSVSNPTGSPEFENAPGGQAKDGTKGRDKGKRNRDGWRGKTGDTEHQRFRPPVCLRRCSRARRSLSEFMKKSALPRSERNPSCNRLALRSRFRFQGVLFSVGITSSR